MASTVTVTWLITFGWLGVITANGISYCMRKFSNYASHKPIILLAVGESRRVIILRKITLKVLDQNYCNIT